MNRKGFTLIELITTLALASVVIVLLLNVVFTIKKMYTKYDVKTKLLIDQANLSSSLNTKFISGNLIDYDVVTQSDDIISYNFCFKSEKCESIEDSNKLMELKLDKSNRLISFGNYMYKYDENTTIDEINVSNSKGILKIAIPIVNKLFEDMDFGINLVYVMDFEVNSTCFVYTGTNDITITNYLDHPLVNGVEDTTVDCSRNVVIPDEIDGKSVAAIAKDAFNNKGITSVEIPEGVTTIGESAFAGNKIPSITIPSSVTSIKNYAFFDNSLTEVIVNGKKSKYDFKSESNYGEEIFGDFKETDIFWENSWQCYFDTKPKKTRLISKYKGGCGHFEGETGKEDIIIPKQITYGTNITSIGDSAFNNKGITSVIFPDSINSIGESSFASNYLTNIEIPKNVATINMDAFRNNNLTNVAITSKVKNINPYAFAYNNFSKIMIPSNVTYIGSDAFRQTNCPTDITVVDANETKFQYNTFASDNGSCSVSYVNGHPCFEYTKNNQGITITNYIVSQSLNCGTDVEIPNTIDSLNVTSIADKAFQYKGITSVTFKNNSSVASIGKYAFAHNNLTSISIPNSVNSIGFAAFYDNQIGKTCASDSSDYNCLNIGTGVTTIEGLAFANNKLYRAIIPDNVATLRYRAFYNNPIDQVIISSPLPNGDSIFSSEYDCTDLDGTTYTCDINYFTTTN